MAQRFVLITGCGEGGIGEALAREYQKHGSYLASMYTGSGCTVITTVLPWESKDHLLSAGIHCYELDVTNDGSVQALARAVDKLTEGRLHVLVNNAGICYTMTCIDTDVNEVQKMFNVNVLGPMRMVQNFHPFLIKAQGTIVSIGSVGGIVPYMYGSSYNATKAALHHWANTVRVEMAPLGVKVITCGREILTGPSQIISGNIGTNILKSDHSRTLPQGSFYSPLAKEFKEHVQRVPDTTPRAVYASYVVPQTLKSSPPAWYWVGATTGIVRFMDIFGFRTVWDYILWPVFNLGKLRKETQAWRQENL